MPVIVYSAQNHNNWAKEAIAILQELSVKKASIVTVSKQMELKQLQLTEINEQLTSLNEQLNAALNHHALLNAVYFADPRIIATSYNIIAPQFREQEEKIRILQQNIAPYEMQKASLEKTINDNRLQLSADVETVKNLEEQKEKLHKQCEKAMEFMKLMTYNPYFLSIKLITFIKKQLDNYDSQFPCNQSKLIREAMIEIRQSLSLLKNQLNKGAENPQVIYLAINGLLSKIAQQQGIEQEIQFQEFIAKLIAKTHIAENGDLPDGFATKLTSVQCYDNLQKHQFDFAAIEKYEFDVAVNQLSKNVNSTTHYSESHHYGKKLLVLTIQNKLAVEKSGKDFDYKNATIILTNTNNLLQNQNDWRFQKQYKQIMNANTTSLCQQIANVMKAFFTAVITAIVHCDRTEDTLKTINNNIDNAARFCDQHGLFTLGIRTGVANKMNNVLTHLNHPTKIIDENHQSALVMRKL